MKQKLAVARVLLHRPELIFLDEPTAGLDPVAAAALRDDLEALVQREGTTVFLNTHNLPEAERLCRQVGVIREGKLVAFGSPDMLRQQTGRPQAEIVGEGFTPEVMSMLQGRHRCRERHHRERAVSSSSCAARPRPPPLSPLLSALASRSKRSAVARPASKTSS